MKLFIALCSILASIAFLATADAALQKGSLYLPPVTHYELPLPPLQPPAPRTFEPSAPPQNQPGHNQSRTEPDQRSTKQPPPHAGEGPVSAQTHSGTQQNESERDDKASTDRWLAIFTGGLVLVGLLQLFVFGRQATRLRESIDLTRDIAGRQERDMQQLIGVARDNAAAAVSQVSAMEAQERVMREQAKIMVFNLDITKATAEAAAKSAEAALSHLRIMIATESPVFAWGGFELELIEGFEGMGVFPNNLYRPCVIVNNLGRSPMELRSFCIETIVGKE